MWGDYIRRAVLSTSGIWSRREPLFDETLHRLFDPIPFFTFENVLAALQTFSAKGRFSIFPAGKGTHFFTVYMEFPGEVIGIHISAKAPCRPAKDNEGSAGRRLTPDIAVAVGYNPQN